LLVVVGRGEFVGGLRKKEHQKLKPINPGGNKKKRTKKEKTAPSKKKGGRNHKYKGEKVGSA